MSESNNILNSRYELLRRAGTGGMSTVYRGRDLMLGRLIAVKVLHESLTSDQEFLKRFQKEAHSAANLTHPNIVTVHDIGQDDRRYYIVMEFVSGWTLKDLVRRQYEQNQRPISIDRSLDLAIQICAGIGYAHRSGLVHCDVKSQNILLTPDDRVKVTDFGIARALSDSSIHKADVVWGTPQYFSPEQAAGETPTPASDVYSIGVIFFEMLTGRLPFEAENHTALAVKHLQESPPLASMLNPGIPDQIDRIIDKVLSKEPAGRYRTADQLGRVLEAYRESTKEDTGPIEGGSSESHYAPAVVGVLTQPTSEQSASNLTMETNWENVTEQRAQNSVNSVSLHYPLPAEEPGTDWMVITLGIMAFLSLLGLIPLWYLVYLAYVN